MKYTGNKAFRSIFELRKEIAVKKVDKKTSFQTLLEAKNILGRLTIKPLFFIIPLALSFLSAMCEGLSLAFLAPLAKGLINRNFDFVRSIPLLGIVMEKVSAFYEKPFFPEFMFITGLIIFFAVLKEVLKYISSLMIGYRQQRLTMELRQKMMERYLGFGKLYFDRTTPGYIRTVLGFAIPVTDLLSMMNSIVNSIFTLGIYFVIMFKASWKVSLFCILIFPAMNYSVSWIINKVRKTSMDLVKALETASVKTYNMLSSISLIKAYSREKEEIDEFTKVNEKRRELQLSVMKKSLLIPGIQSSMMLVASMLLLFFMAYLVVAGKGKEELSGFLVIFFVLRRLGNHFQFFNSAKLALAQVGPKITRVKDVFDDKDKFRVKSGTRNFSGLKSNIEIQGLNFAYLKGRPILKDISFTIEKGKMIAIVGETGVGKTTIVQLIMRFYDCPPDSIKIDGTDIREFNIQSFRKKISFVGQDNMIINDTIKKNILFGVDHASEKDLIKAVKNARLFDFIIDLPYGFDTMVGDRGVMLSGGEKQRVSIARALLRKAEIIILDEATSALDSVTERMIREAIDEVVKDRTTIAIAHRLSTIKNADKVIVLDEGKVAEHGTLDELVEREGLFYKFWKEQKFD